VVYLELLVKRVIEATEEILVSKVLRVDREKGVFQEWLVFAVTNFAS
jgi:hypothetical protein